MKKRIIGLLIVIALALGLSGVLIACDEGEKADYSVTVLSPADEPVSGVTVSWMLGSKEAGSAETGSNGTATASLPLATYTVELKNYGEGYSYTSASVSASMREVILELSVKTVEYTVTVLDYENKPAKNVTVTWMRENGAVAGTALTNASGKATKELAYGNYRVTVDNLPAGNVDNGGKSVSGKNPNVTFNLESGTTVTYKVTARSEGGLLFKKRYDEEGALQNSNSLSLIVYEGNELKRSGMTDENGVFSFSVKPGNYTVRVGVVPNGYTYTPLSLTSDTLTTELVLYSSVITTAPAEDTDYVIGDIIHNYTFSTPYEMKDTGEVWSKSIAEILKEKEVLIINNWGTGCSACTQEMPAMEDFYLDYKDRVEIVAVDNYGGIDQSTGQFRISDTTTNITSYYKQKGYSFPLVRDTNAFYSKFKIEGWPTTIIVDRYGAIARIESIAIASSEAWEAMILKFLGDDYEQTFVPGVRGESINQEIAKPDITVPDDHYEKLGQAINKTETFPSGSSVEWYGETEYEYAWPFLFDQLDDVGSDDEPVMYASSSRRPYSQAIIYASVTMQAGKVFAFDYFAETEEGLDVFYITWDGRRMQEISGDSNGWQTCYLFAEIVDGTHELAFLYRKDFARNVGKDNVFIKNVRFVDVADIDQPLDMLRTAGYGDVADNQFSHYATASLKEDGFYHVNLSSLENSEYAGNDESPLLFVNLLNVTPWSSYYLSELVGGVDEETGEFLYNCTFEIGGVTADWRDEVYQYMVAASASYVKDCIPVDKFMHDFLVKFMPQVSGANSHENEWLEVCYFYSHYGAGEPVGNPILGVMDKTAIPMETDRRYEANLTRDMYPFPIERYTFTPQESAVYKLESFIPARDAGEYDAQIWLYDEEGDPDHALAYSGDTRITLNFENIQNFELYYYLQAGHKYYIAVAFLSQMSGKYEFMITNAGQEVTEFVPCSEDVYEMVIEGDDESGFTGDLKLIGAVDYEKDEQGFYHAKNADGTRGSYIYLDVFGVHTGALGGVSIKKLVDMLVPDPDPNDPLGREAPDYKFFDFRYCVVYADESDDTGFLTSLHSKKENLNSRNPILYQDYTDVLKGYIDAAPTEGELKGMIKVNDELVKILTLYIELRLNMVFTTYVNNEIKPNIEPALENEWLRFCWYYRKHDANNP